MFHAGLDASYKTQMTALAVLEGATLWLGELGSSLSPDVSPPRKRGSLWDHT
jgi:hypothetical protein